MPVTVSEHRTRSVALALVVAMIAALLGVVAANPAAAADGPVFYFHGSADDQALKETGLLLTGPQGSASFDQTNPTGAVPVTQLTTNVANQDYVGNPLTAYWHGPVGTPMTGVLQLDWFWSSANPATIAGGTQVTVTLFANPDYAADPEQANTIIGRGVVTLAAGATPTENVGQIEVDSNGAVVDELLIQVAATSLTSGDDLKVHYDSTLTPSSWQLLDRPISPTPTVVFDSGAGITFAPATTVSATFFGAEPQTAMERPIYGSDAGRVDPDRLFVDWPVSSRTNIGQISRSLDGGDSFRLLYDFLCAPRSRPTCATGGGGDTDTEVNPFNGNLYFADQESLAQEALASSVDHGDSWPLPRQFALTNATTATDRQWLTSVRPGTASFQGRDIEAFLSWHLPAAAQYVVGIDSDGLPIPQPAPQIFDVSQSGPMRADNGTGPAGGWLYQPYRNGAGFQVASAPAAEYATGSAWRSNLISADQPTIFPWFALDTYGNAYAAWATGGAIYLSVSPIDDPRNDPTAGPAGWPGTYWTPKARISSPAMASTVFPAVVAGDPGRIAIAYLGSTDCATAGVSDNCQLEAHWEPTSHSSTTPSVWPPATPPTSPRPG